MIRHHKGIFFALAAFSAPIAAQVPAVMPATAAPVGGAPEGIPMSMHHPEACATPAPLPAPLSGWVAPHVTMVAARKPGNIAHATLRLGQAADIILPHTPDVTYEVQPHDPGGTVSYGGLFAFDVTAAGTYRVAMNSHAWVDVIENGVARTSIAHGHGPVCTGVAKMVDYVLKPGWHLLQITAQGEPKLTLMVTQAP